MSSDTIVWPRQRYLLPNKLCLKCSLKFKLQSIVILHIDLEKETASSPWQWTVCRGRPWSRWGSPCCRWGARQRAWGCRGAAWPPGGTRCLKYVDIRKSAECCLLLSNENPPNITKRQPSRIWSFLHVCSFGYINSWQSWNSAYSHSQWKFARAKCPIRVERCRSALRFSLLCCDENKCLIGSSFSLSLAQANKRPYNFSGHFAKLYCRLIGQSFLL